MLVGARVAERAVAFLECLAERPVGGNTEAIFALEEVGEGEVVVWWGSGGIEDLLNEERGRVAVGFALRFGGCCGRSGRVEGIRSLG